MSLAAASENSGISRTIFQAYKILKDQIEDCEGGFSASRAALHAPRLTYGCFFLHKSTVSQVVQHVLPCIHGIYRAITSTPARWTKQDLEQLHTVTEPLSSGALSNIASISRGSFIHSSLQGRYVLSVLARYDMSGSPFSTNFVTKCDTEMAQAILLGSILPATMLSPSHNWQQLASGTIKPVSDAITDASHLSQVAAYAKTTLANSLDVLRDLGEEEDSILEGTDVYEIQTITNCLVRGCNDSTD